MDKKSISMFIVGLAVGILVSVSGFAYYLQSGGAEDGNSGKIVLKLGHGLDQLHPVHLGMMRMGELLAEKSGGTMELQVFSGGVLGSEKDNIEQLINGALAMTKVSTAALESFIPEMAVFSLPYIFRDEAHYWTVLNDPLGREILTYGESAGMRGVCYYDSGSRNFYTVKTPIMTPADLVGKKIRVMESKTPMDMVEVLGGYPTPISWGELYTALQQGMVDGAENNPPSFYTNRHFEVCKKFSMDEHTRIPDILLINAQIWQRLTPQQQAWLQEAADESSLYQRELWKKKTQECLEAMQTEGVEILYPDKKPFEEKVQPLLDRYKGTRIGDLVNRIKGIQ